MYKFGEGEMEWFVNAIKSMHFRINQTRMYIRVTVFLNWKHYYLMEIAKKSKHRFKFHSDFIH